MTETSIECVIWIQEFFGAGWLPIMEFFSKFLGHAPGYILLILFISSFIDWNLGNRLFLYLGAAQALNTLLKVMIAAKRPYQLSDTVKIHFDRSKEVGYGMPSGHAQIIATVWGGMALNMKKCGLTLVALLVIGMTGLSRIYLGVHSIEQVVAGYVVALVFIVLIRQSEHKIRAFAHHMSLVKQIGVILLLSTLMMSLSSVVLIRRYGDVQDRGLTLFTKLNDIPQGLGLAGGILIGTLIVNSIGRIQIDAKWSVKIIRFCFAVIIFVTWVAIIEEHILFAHINFYYLSVMSFVLRLGAGLLVSLGLPLVLEKFRLLNIKRSCSRS